MYIVVGIISSQTEYQIRAYMQYREVKSRSGIVQNVSVVVCWVAITGYITVKIGYGQGTVRSRHSTVKIQYGVDTVGQYTVRSRYSTE